MHRSKSSLNDAAPTHPLHTAGLELFCACSFAKNMGLYGERIGALHALTTTR